MKRLTMFVVAVALACAVANITTAGGQKDKEKPPVPPVPVVPVVQIELKLLDGTWQLVSREVDGQKEELQNTVIRATVKDGKYTIQVADNVVEQGSFRIDPTTKPKSIDAIPESGDNKGKTILAVYDLAGDDLRMCVAPEGNKRPTEIASKQGFIVNAYKRQAPPKQ